MEQVLKEKFNELVIWANRNDKTIHYKTVEDILRDKNDTVTALQIVDVMKRLEKLGVYIINEADETYSVEDTDSDYFIPADVNIGQRPTNVYNLMERLLHREIDLEPEFQRHGNLWSLQNQSRLIESLMLKIPILAFYFNAVDENKWVVIDGLQRLTAFQNYLVGVLNEEGEREKAKFVGLQYLTEFNGFTFDELPRQYIRRIKEASVVAYTVEKGTPDIVVYNIFQRINTGGLHLNPQEIRQAMYNGVATRLIQELAESEEFLLATQCAIPRDRMIDREYVTRFIAFTELAYQTEYKGNIDSFLIKALKAVNKYTESELRRIEYNFKRYMYYSFRIFEQYAFRKINENWRRGPINKALFEMWAVCFSELSDTELDYIVKNRQHFLSLL